MRQYRAGRSWFWPEIAAFLLALETALRILCGGPAGMPMIADRIPKVLGEDEEVGFPLTAVLKDNDVFQRVVRSYGLNSPMLERFNAQTKAAIKAGFGGHDPAVLINVAYDRAGDA